MSNAHGLADRFEPHREHLRGVAYRMLGSLPDAEDAVQEAWLRFMRADVGEIRNLAGWLTTVVSRICLDALRSRSARREDLVGGHEADEHVDRSRTAQPEQEAVLVDEVNEIFDIMPTMLELAGTRATHTHFARSLVPQLRGAPGDPLRAAFVEGGYNVYEPQAFEPKLGGLYAPKTNLQNDQPASVSRVASVKTQRFSFTARPGAEGELYDRKKDPGLTVNLINSRAHSKVREDMQVRLMNRYINTTGVPPRDKDSRDTPPFYPTPDFNEAARALEVTGD